MFIILILVRLVYIYNIYIYIAVSRIYKDHLQDMSHPIWSTGHLRTLKAGHLRTLQASHPRTEKPGHPRKYAHIERSSAHIDAGNQPFRVWLGGWGGDTSVIDAGIHGLKSSLDSYIICKPKNKKPTQRCEEKIHTVMSCVMM